MAIHDDSANPTLAPTGGYFARFFFSDHKAIGLQYLWLALLSVLVGMLLSTLLRVHVSWPGASIPLISALENSPQSYAALRLLHGSLMVFFVLTAAPQLGFGNFFLPLQIGASEMAFPNLNLFSLYLTFASFLGMTASVFLPVNIGFNLWLASAAIFSLAALFSALNFTITTIELRAPGLTLPRLPITVWAWLINAILSLLIFSVLLAGLCAILSDRLLHAQFFPANSFLALQPIGLVTQGSVPVLWQRLFWYFAQAQVYVAMLPCFGFATHLLAIFSHKPIWKERLVVLALCGVGLVGFCVWGYHMFATGLNPYAPLVFAVLASSLGAPALILLASWLRTLWNARAQFTTALLFVLGFISLFMAGGLSGIFLARQDLQKSAVSEDFVVGHFHLVMGVAATFAILAALFFWFPKLFHRRLNEPLGKLHFWMTFAGVYSIFMPMHWLGLLTQSHFLADPQRALLASSANSIRSFVVVATIWTVAAQTLFVANFIYTLLQPKEIASNNPWLAPTLEWSTKALAAASASPTVYRGAYELHAFAQDGFIAQDRAPESLTEQSR
jgi:cytochrome c oxidase subunit 1